MTTLIPQGGVKIESQDSDHVRLMKHVRRNDMFRLLKDLGYEVSSGMSGSDLRAMALAHRVDVFKYMDKRLLRYNPRSKAVTETTKQYMSRDSSPNPVIEGYPSVGEGIHTDIPVITPPLPQSEKAMTPLGLVDLEDLTQGALIKLCLERGIQAKPNLSKKVLMEKLRTKED